MFRIPCMEERILRLNMDFEHFMLSQICMKIHIWTKCINIKHTDTEWTPKHLKQSCGAESFSIIYDYVLVSAGVKLILFTVPSVRLWFGFVLKMWLIIQRIIFLYCWAVFTQAKASSASCTTPTARRLGVHRELEARQNLHCWSQLSTGYSIPYRIMLTNKWWGRDKETERMLSLAFATIICAEALLSWDNWTPPAQSEKQWINFLDCLLLAHVAVSQPTSFLTPTLPILCPILLVVEWVSSCLGLSCWLGLNHGWLPVLTLNVCSMYQSPTRERAPNALSPYSHHLKNQELAVSTFGKYHPKQCNKF